jgi:hypothetical protein
VTSTGGDLDQVLLSDMERWLDGPPHDLFRQMRAECPSSASCSRRLWRAIRRCSQPASPTWVRSTFVNQLKNLPVRLAA